MACACGNGSKNSTKSIKADCAKYSRDPTRSHRLLLRQVRRTKASKVSKSRITGLYQRATVASTSRIRENSRNERTASCPRLSFSALSTKSNFPL
ncbi:unnamed protein product [Chondrus crispus]|uniref:Uncharacterized protein n=1 Tax=Chondrus crispus TaxID=2769 RepID=R7QT14_CHOCR|nr:unnamed protein product [Chondrus crispus]CDF40868.1 unnamed protein product [Chondrus crispus]|eukprot:XP_005711162.1 unnamed protein product [Chondrus crispus]